MDGVVDGVVSRKRARPDDDDAANLPWKHVRRERDTVRCLRAENAHLRALVARLTTDVERAARAMAWSRSALVAAGALPPEPWVGTVPF